MSDRCPACDVTNGVCTPIEALALGIGLGDSFGQAATREMMCPTHRTRYVMAMMHTTLKIQGLAVPNEAQCEHIGPSGVRCTKPANHVNEERVPTHDERPREPVVFASGTLKT